LLDFDVVEWFFQDQQAVVGVQAKQQVIPGVVRVGGAHHHLQIGGDFPQLFNGLGTVPALGHAHVDEGQGIGPLLRHGAGQQAQAFLAAIRAVQFERLGLRFGRVAKQCRLHLIQRFG